MGRSQRWYFLLLGIACAVGWATGLWGIPPAAYVMLEAAWTLAERTGAARRHRYVR